MKLFNSMNCLEIETSGRLDVKNVTWISLFNSNCLFAFEKNFSLHHQKKTPSLVLSTSSVTWTEE